MIISKNMIYETCLLYQISFGMSIGAMKIFNIFIREVTGDVLRERATADVRSPISVRMHRKQ